MTSSPAHAREGTGRVPYSKPRNARRDAVMSRRAALAQTWHAGLDDLERLRLARCLDRWRVWFAAAGERPTAAELQRLRQDVLNPALPTATIEREVSAGDRPGTGSTRGQGGRQGYR